MDHRAREKPGGPFVLAPFTDESNDDDLGFVVVVLFVMTQVLLRRVWPGTGLLSRGFCGGGARGPSIHPSMYK